jgi:ABC-2 type transport system ATP-binding protein
MFAIEADQLVREFRNGPRAVDRIDLAVAPGEIYGFLGPNGAGKSTTVHMLTTLLPPTSGSARVAGFDIVHQGAQVRMRIGAALQEAALVHSPPVLFLDEPTTGLDIQSRTALWTEVGRLAREDGVTVFLTTQYLEEADVLADRVGIIDHGRIVAEGTPTELKAEVGRPTVEAIPAEAGDRSRVAAILGRFGEPVPSPKGVAVRLSGDEELAGIVRVLDAEELKVEHLQLHQPSLDDVFLAKTGRSLEGAGEGEGQETPGRLEMEPARA